MKQEIIKSELEVNDNKIKVITIDNKEVITFGIVKQGGKKTKIIYINLLLKIVLQYGLLMFLRISESIKGEYAEGEIYTCSQFR